MPDIQPTSGTQPTGWVKRIVWFLTGQTISLFGSSLVQYAIIWYITLTTSSGLMMTISTACGFLPQILISLFAGVWADRFDRKKLIMLADGTIAASTLVLAILFLCGFRDLWLLFVVSGIRSVGAGVQTPAVNALIPQMVPADRLMKVNGINGSVQSLTLLISPAVSGAMLSGASLDLVSVFFVDIVTAVIGIGILFFLPVERQVRETVAKGGYFDDLKAGLAYVGRQRFLRSFLFFYAILMFLVTPAAFLTPLMIARSFGDEVWRLTANEILFSGGTMLGGLLLAVWGGFRNRMHTLLTACAVFGLLTAALGFSSHFIVYLILIALTGLSMSFMNSPSLVLLQEKVEGSMQGRVFGLVQIISASAMPLGMAVFGPIADHVRVEWLLIGTGICMAVCSVLLFLDRGLVRAGLPCTEVGNIEQPADPADPAPLAAGDDDGGPGGPE